MDNCNCNVNYDKIKKRIEECNKNIKHLYIQGPTGPVGPQGQDGIQGPTGPTGPKGENGPTTIDIGTTETGDPNTEASVKNVGTNKNVILNFTIPKGQNGIDGDKVIINTIGYGHGVGMSQYGAEGMAEEGYSYVDILKHYYVGTNIKKIEN